MPVFDLHGKRVEFTGDYAGSYDCINKGRFYEFPFLETVRGMALQGIYLDVGTNVGNHAVYFAMFCEATKVIGFEPMARWRARALDNIRANGCEHRVQVFPDGLLDRPGTLDFNPHGSVYRLDCKTLDILLPEVEGVVFVKMDIEGSEPKALLGGKEFFRRNRPVIAAEVLGSTDELAAAAETIGYRMTGRVFPSTPGSPMYELLPERSGNPVGLD